MTNGKCSARHAALALLIPLALLPSCGPISLTIGSKPEGKLTATVVQEETGFGGDRIAMIDISGFLQTGPSQGLLSERESPVGLLHEKLDKAAADPRIKAVILRINSPGGSVTASDIMYREAMRFRQRSGKPLVVLMQDVAASGGYYLACAADHIVAHPTTVTGSIGVILQTVSVKPLLQRIGVEAEAITSGPNKAIASPLEELKEEHRRLLQAMVDDFYSRFTAVVKDRRPNIPAEKFPTVTDGRVFTGAQAIDLALIDEVGDLYAAFTAAKRLAQISSADLILLHRQGRFVSNIYSTTPTPPGAATQINLAQFNVNSPLNDPTAVFLYLWRPELE